MKRKAAWGWPISESDSFCSTATITYYTSTMTQTSIPLVLSFRLKPKS